MRQYVNNKCKCNKIQENQAHHLPPYFSPSSPRRKVPVCISISYNKPLLPYNFPSSRVLVNGLVPMCLPIPVACY